MRNLKKFGTLAVAVLALSAIGAANASAAYFTYSEPGSLTGSAVNNQVFAFNGGTVTCSNAATSGTIENLGFTEQHFSVKYSGCTAFGFATVDTLGATYLITAGGGLHFKGTFTITPTFFGASVCTVTIGEQSVGTLDYSNASASAIRVDPTVTGIKYVSSGGACGESGENGTFSGASVISRVGGGSVQYDA